MLRWGFVVGSSFYKKFALISLLSVPAFMLVSCAKSSTASEAKGDVRVKIGLQTSASNYDLQVVQLRGIEKLEEVSGQFARFFFSPGSSGPQLTGVAPRAQFIHSKNFFVPSDVLSMQMAVIYYHLQNLAFFDKEIGADGVNHWPRSVGLETQINDNSSGESALQKNNAFYNGQTDSMMFVPYTKNNLPIAVNAGIIAHEHFHSLFYKIVIRTAMQSQKVGLRAASVHSEDNLEPVRGNVSLSSTDQEKAQTFNETLLRGVNEGIADFWGWIYTDDPEFMRWSLPEYQGDRTLVFSEELAGQYKSKENIKNKIEEITQSSANPQASLVKYSYEIGTPYARFLKQMSLLQAKAKNLALADSKKIMGQVVFNYIKELGEKVKVLKEKEILDPLSLFDYVAHLAQEQNLVRLDKDSCDFLIKYINFDGTDQTKLSQCKELTNAQKGQKDSSFVVVKP